MLCGPGHVIPPSCAAFHPTKMQLMALGFGARTSFPSLPSCKSPITNTGACKNKKGRGEVCLLLTSSDLSLSSEHPLQQLSPLLRALSTPPLLPARQTLSLQMAVVCFVVTDVWSNLARRENKTSSTFPFLGLVGVITASIHLVCLPKSLQCLQGCGEM